MYYLWHHIIFTDFTLVLPPKAHNQWAKMKNYYVHWEWSIIIWEIPRWSNRYAYSFHARIAKIRHTTVLYSCVPETDKSSFVYILTKKRDNAKKNYRTANSHTCAKFQRRQKKLRESNSKEILEVKNGYIVFTHINR